MKRYRRCELAVAVLPPSQVVSDFASFTVNGNIIGHEHTFTLASDYCNKSVDGFKILREAGIASAKY